MTSDRVSNVDSGELWLSVDSDADYGDTIAAVERVTAGYAGFESRVVSYSNLRAQEVLTDSGNDLTVRVFGPNLELLREEADDVLRFVSTTSGVVDARIDLPIEEPTLEVEVDLAAAQEAGVKPGDVRRAAAILLSGINVGSLFEDQKVFDVVVWGVPELRQSVSDVLELPIETPDGDPIPLGELADIRIAPNPTVIRHESVSRYLDIIATVDGRGIGAVESDIGHAIASSAFPLEYHAEIVDTDGGTSTALLIGMILAAVVGAFLLLQAALGSWRHATLALVALPLGLAGGVLAVLADGGTASIGSVIGFFALGAITMRHAMLVIRRCQELEHGDPAAHAAYADGDGTIAADGHEMNDRVAFGPELVAQAARERVAPIMLTTVALGLATLPVLIRGSIAGHELLQPLAVVVLGGLVTAALVNLFVVPLLYLRFGPSPEPISMELGQAGSLVSELMTRAKAPQTEVVSMRDVQAAARRRHWLRPAKYGALGLAVLVAGLALAGCGGSSDSGSGAAYEEPATIDTSGATARLTLTEQAAARLDITLDTVQESGGTTTIPYAAVLYEPDGSTWAFTNREELVYMRESISIERVVDDTAFLSDGPEAGTNVVTVGVVELWGTELGIE